MERKSTQWKWMLLLLPAIVFAGCKSDKGDVAAEAPPHDPTKPVVISGFTPESGSALSQLLIAGENFGTDKEQLSVTVGGVEAVIIEVNGTNIYCFVPNKAYTGIIEVAVGTKPAEGETDTRKKATAEKAFAYQRETVVGTIAGYRNINDDQGWRAGPFEGPDGVRASGFARSCVLAFDPLDHNLLYVGYDCRDDAFSYIQLVDLKNRQITNTLSLSRFLVNGNLSVRSIDFSQAIPEYDKPAGQYMIVSFDVAYNNFTTPSVFLVERNEAGTFDDTCTIVTLASYKQCNGASVHPNGEIYFNSYEKGQVFRMDLRDYLADPTGWNPHVLENEHIEQLFTIADPSWEFKIFIHPTGDYAYLVVINNHYIMRTDYNHATKRFITPYTVAGHYKAAGYKEGIGTDAYFDQPYQGVFVKNAEYTEGDGYDFYFTEFHNHCVSRLTPTGVVETFAGRGTSTSAGDGNIWGADDGALRTMARFRDPTGLAYDEATETFYVVSTVGRTLRTFSMDKGEE